MKNQYFGDINDYKKYGILRTLSGNGQIKIGICWMLTEDNAKNEGKFTSYVKQPGKWRKYDPPLFDSLLYALADLKKRNVELAEQLNLIDNSNYFTRLLKDSSLERELYFQEFKTNTSGCDLIFFDPDNGIEVKSKPYGRKDSNKYIYWKEIQETYQAGQSILIYQHFPRVIRETFIENTLNVIRSSISIDTVIFYETSNVLFIIIPQKERKDYFFLRSTEVESDWYPEIKFRIRDNI